MTAPAFKRTQTDPGSHHALDVTPNRPEERAAALAYLRRTDNLDVAEALGLDEEDEL